MNQPDLTVGALLQAWRVANRQSATELAKQTSCAVSAVTQWEHHQRRPDQQTIQALDRGLRAAGAFVDFSAALGTTAGLPSRLRWEHNFRGGPRPVWVWLRTADSKPQSVRVGCGALTDSFVMHPSKHGLLVTSPSSLSNPETWVEFERHGWADFGTGVIPNGLGISNRPFARTARIANREQGHADMAAALIGHDSWRRRVVTVLGRKTGLYRDAFSDQRLPATVHDVRNPPANTDAGMVDLRQLRLARNLSQAELAEQVRRLAQAPLSADTIGALELGKSIRSINLLPAIDQVLRADGYLYSQTIHSRAIPGAPIRFPDFWVGPVWFRFHGPAGSDSMALLQWGGWQKRILVTNGTTVHCRKAHEGRSLVEVDVNPSWFVEAGIGRSSASHDIQRNWGIDPTHVFQVARPILESAAMYLNVRFDRLWDAIRHRS
jgi:transcriptional regulator with XRE-family HTH domain